jgi:hypothetical protein
MATVLHVYKEVEIIHDGLLRGAVRELGMVTISYDEKPGLQALTTPDRPPVVGQHASHLRDYEYKRLGTVSLLAGWTCTAGGSSKPLAIRTTAAISSHFLRSWKAPILRTRGSV